MNKGCKCDNGSGVSDTKLCKGGKQLCDTCNKDYVKTEDNKCVPAKQCLQSGDTNCKKWLQGKSCPTTTTGICTTCNDGWKTDDKGKCVQEKCKSAKHVKKDTGKDTCKCITNYKTDANTEKALPYNTAKCEKACKYNIVLKKSDADAKAAVEGKTLTGTANSVLKQNEKYTVNYLKGKLEKLKCDGKAIIPACGTAGENFKYTCSK